MTKSITKTKAAAELLKPVVGALEKGKSKIEVPEVARNFVIRTAETVKERAASVNARAQKATAAFETAATDSIAGVVKASRSVQSAVYDDTKAMIAAVEKIASAKTLSEAAHIQVEYLSERGQLRVARAKSVAEFLTKALQHGAKTAGDNFPRLTAKGSKAA